MSPILYSFRRCPYAMRARMALFYANIHYEHREILLKDKPLSMLSYSQKGTVPVLVIDNRVIDESLEIMNWALDENDKDNWSLKDNKLHDEMMKLIQLCDNEFKPQLDRYKYSDRHELTEIEYRDKSLWFLQLLNKKLIEHPFLCGKHVSLADIAIFPFIRQYAFVNKKWFDSNEYIYLHHWFDSQLNSRLFTGIMQKHDLWQDNT